jgi:hypothetical protein
MLHLPIERLAELGESEPTVTERAHLAECTMCSTELAAYQRLVAMAADERRRIAPPLTSWGTLREPLRDEGLIITQEHQIAQRRRSALLGRVGRVAAMLLLLAGGVVIGRFSAGLPMAEAIAFVPVRDSLGNGTMSVEQFATTKAAMDALREAQREYERAAYYLATHDTTNVESTAEVYRTRLAALDEMAEASLRALEQAPADPIMNQVYLSTLGAREMTLARLGSTLPVGARLTRF